VDVANELQPGAEFGVILKDCSVEQIQHTVQTLSSRPVQDLERMSRGAWEFARQNHTRDRFAEAYREAVLQIMG
jgi:hypothetical protein